MALTADIIDRHRMGDGGNSGSVVERVTLRDGRRLILKRVSPEWDWMARTTNDGGRLSAMWEDAIFDRMPSVIDHTIVDVEMDGDAWNIFMRDAASDLLPHDRRVSREDVRRILSAMHEMHEIFREEGFPDLCSLVDRYVLLSPKNVRREQELDNPHGHILSRGWEAFPEFVSETVAEAIFAVGDKPKLLAETARDLRADPRPRRRSPGQPRIRRRPRHPHRLERASGDGAPGRRARLVHRVRCDPDGCLAE
jgi:hypothetical protein